MVMKLWRWRCGDEGVGGSGAFASSSRWMMMMMMSPCTGSIFSPFMSLQFLHLPFPIFTLPPLPSFSLHSHCHFFHFPPFCSRLVLLLLPLSPPLYVSLPCCSALELLCDRNFNIAAQLGANSISARLCHSLIPFTFFFF